MPLSSVVLLSGRARGRLEDPAGREIDSRHRGSLGPGRSSTRLVLLILRQ